VKTRLLFIVCVILLLTGAIFAFWQSEHDEEKRLVTGIVDPLATTVPSPTPEHEELDLRTSRRLNREEVALLYKDRRTRIESYRSVKVRSRFEFPDLVENNRIEFEIQFDAIRPDRWVKKTYASKRVSKNNPYSDWEFGLQQAARLLDGISRNIQYWNHRVYDTDITDPDELIQALVLPERRRAREAFKNPYQDLLFTISDDDRMKEMLEATRERKSDGDEIHVLFRMNKPFMDAFLKNTSNKHWPMSRKGSKQIALREDVFDAETREIKKIYYYDVSRNVFLSQAFLDLDWDVDIPASRFELEIPEPSVSFDLNDYVKKHAAKNAGMTQEDRRKKMLEMLSNQERGSPGSQ